MFIFPHRFHHRYISFCLFLEFIIFYNAKKAAQNDKTVRSILRSESRLLAQRIKWYKGKRNGIITENLSGKTFSINFLGKLSFLVFFFFIYFYYYYCIDHSQTKSEVTLTRNLFRCFNKQETNVEFIIIKVNRDGLRWWNNEFLTYIQPATTHSRHIEILMITPNITFVFNTINLLIYLMLENSCIFYY